MKILFVTPECVPLVKTGGLADVSGALPAALRTLGHDARILLPGFPGVLAADPGAKEVARLTVLQFYIRLLESRLPSGAPIYIAESPGLYGRPGGPYQKEDGHDWEDNAVRFGVLSRIAAILGSAASPIDWRPDVVHCNDWQTALAPVYLRSSGNPRAATLLTIHNLAFQGIFSPDQIVPLELPAASLGLDGLEYYGNYSLLKGGLMYADAISTVSPTYAREIQTEALGFGLDGVLKLRSSVLTGVRNGIDTELWNPATDPRIPHHFTAADLEGKLENKRALKRRLHLAGPDDVPLLALVSRLTHQKGIDVLAQAAHAFTLLPAQLIVLGSGDREMVGTLQAIRARHPQDVAVNIGFDEDLAHLVEAGADIFLMPSRFEPCGMNQMYSQRYGTLPVAHATGGLVDTIQDGVTGFLIPAVTPEALVAGVERAVAAYRNPRRWLAMQREAMARDFGWPAAAQEYAAIYARITATSSVPSRTGA